MELLHLPELRAAADRAVPGIQWTGNDGVVPAQSGMLRVRASHDHETTQLVFSMPISDVPIQAWFGSTRMHLAGVELMSIEGPLAAGHRVAGTPESLLRAALQPALQAQLVDALPPHRHILIEHGVATIPLGRLNTDAQDIRRAAHALDALCLALRVTHRQALADAHAAGGQQAANALNEKLQAEAAEPMGSPWITVAVVVGVLALVAAVAAWLA